MGERKRKLSWIFIISIISVVIIVGGCSNSNESSNNTATEESDSAEPSDGETSSSAGESESATDTSTATDSDSSTGLSVSVSDSAKTESSEESPKSIKNKSEIGDREIISELILPKEPKPNPQQAESGLLTAGEWSDLKNWDWWLDLMNNKEWGSYQEHWGFTTYQRVSVIVESDGEPIIDAEVKLINGSQDEEWSARTNNKGEAELFVNLFAKQEASPYQLQIKTDVEVKTIEQVEINQDEPLVVELDSKFVPSDVLDLMFVVDTTGSMGDELDYLAEELKDVIQRVERANDNYLSIRVSTNFYRDHGDDYLIRAFKFRTDVDQVIEQINEQSAKGGGDYEEAVPEALDDAINHHQWSAEAKARLLFLVMDAPPHHTNENVEKLQELAAEAASQGIRIIPVASSGVDKDTEFLMRLMSIASGGTYVFLTDDSGIGNSHIEPTIGQYDVEMLNDLLVRVVNEYLE